jgi:hypothetical protein
MHMLFGYRTSINRLVVQEPQMGQGFLNVEESRPHSIGLLWTSDQRQAENPPWQHTTLTTNIPTPSGVRTPNPSKLVAADPCHGPRSHWLHEVWSQNINLEYNDVKFRRINGDVAHCSISDWISFMSNTVVRTMIGRRSDLSFRCLGYRPYCSLLLFMIRKRDSTN